MNNSINIFPSRSRPTTRPIGLIKANESSSKPYKYQFLPSVTELPVSIKVPKSNISNTTTQFQYVSGINQTIPTPIESLKTETHQPPTDAPSSNSVEIDFFPELISNLTTQSPSVLTITQSNSSPFVVVKTESSNHPDQPESSMSPESAVDSIESIIFQKHEFEGEVPDDEYPDTDECVNTTVSLGSGQEIDETIYCSSNTTTTTTETFQEIDDSDDSSELKERNFNFTIGSFIPPVSELPKVKVPEPAKWPLEFLKLKPKIVTLTNFIIKPVCIDKMFQLLCQILIAKQCGQISGGQIVTKLTFSCHCWGRGANSAWMKRSE